MLEYQKSARTSPTRQPLRYPGISVLKAQRSELGRGPVADFWYPSMR